MNILHLSNVLHQPDSIWKTLPYTVLIGCVMCNGANTFDTAALVFKVMLMLLLFLLFCRCLCYRNNKVSSYFLWNNKCFFFAILFNIFLFFLFFFFFYQMSAGNQSAFSCSTVQVSFGSITSLAMSCSDLQGPSLGKFQKSNSALSKIRNLWDDAVCTASIRLTWR